MRNKLRKIFVHTTLIGIAFYSGRIFERYTLDRFIERNKEEMIQEFINAVNAKGEKIEWKIKV